MKKLLALLMSCMIVFISCATTLSPVAMQDEEYANGATQGKLDGGSGLSVGWSGVGCLFGPFGVLAGALVPGSAPPSVTTLTLNKKSEKYKLGYLEGYQVGSQSKSLRSALIGWVLWIPIGLSIYLASE